MRLLLFILDAAMLFKEQELVHDWERHPEAFTSTGHTLFLKWVGGWRECSGVPFFKLYTAYLVYTPMWMFCFK